MRIRRDVLSGIAAVSMFGAAQTARAEDNRFKPDIQRHQARDGRGETVEYRQNIVRPDQMGVSPVERPQSVKPYTDGCARPLPLKAELRAHFSEMPESMKMISVSASSASDDNRTAEQRQKDHERFMAQFPMKTEITMRINTERGSSEGTESTGPSVQGQQRNSANRAALNLLPVKSEIRMRMHSGGDGQADEK